MAIKLQPDKDRDKYVNQIYGGSPPSMDYYRQLGATKRANEEAAAAAKRAAREAESAAKKAATKAESDRKKAEKDAETKAKKAKKEAEKAAKEKETQDLLDNLLNPKTSKTQQDAVGATTKPKKGNTNRSGLSGILGDYAAGAKTFVQAVNPFDDVSFKEAAVDFATRKRTKGTQEVQRFTQRAADSATFGALGAVEKKLSGQAPAYTQDRAFGDGGGLDILSSLTGSLGPGGLIAGGLRGTKLGANITKGMSKGAKALQRGKEGAAAGAMYGVADAGLTELLDPSRRNVSEHARNIALETLFGGVADPALGGVFDVFGRRAGVTLAEQAAKRTSDLSSPRSTTPNLAPSPTPSPMAAPNVLSQAPVPDINLGPSYRSVPTATRPDISVRTNQNVPDLQTRVNQLDTLIPQHKELNTTLEQSKNAFVDDFVNRYQSKLPSNEKEVADGAMQWDVIKQQRDDYDNIRKKIDKFYIPKDHAEEYKGLFPRSFLASSDKAGMDVFSAAQAFGFSGDHEGVLKFGQMLRALQESKTVKKGDIVPKETGKLTSQDLEEVRNVGGAAFPETEDYQAIKPLLDAFDADIQSLQNPNILGNLNIQANAGTANNPLATLANLGRSAPSNAPTGTPTATLAGTGGRGQQPPGQPPQQPGTGTPPTPQQPTNVEAIDFGNKTRGDAETVISKTDHKLEQFSDRFRPVKVVEREIKKAGSDAYENAYRDVRLVPGAAGAGEHYMTQNLLKPLQDLEKKGIDMKQAWNYATNLHLKRVKELDPKYVLPGGKNMAQIEKEIADFGQNSLNVEFAETVKKVQRDMLDLMHETGDMISAKQKADLIKTFPDYLPLFRQKGKQSIDDFMNQYTSGNVRKVLYDLKHGSEDLIKDPLGNLSDYVMNAHQAAFTNKAMQHIAKLEGIKINGHNLAKKVTKNTAGVNNNFVVRFKQNGKDVAYELTPDLFRAYSNLKVVMPSSTFGRFAAAVGKVQRQSITANPIFTIKQLVRDIPEAYINGKFSLFTDLLPATLDMLSGGKLKSSQLKEFYKHGAGYGNIVSMDRTSNYALKRAAKQLKGNDNIKDVAEGAYQATIGKALDTLRRFNEATENLPKYAQFRATAKRTGDLDQAAFEARDIMDFSMSGSITQHINRQVAFLNANIRGKERFARALKERPLETIPKMVVVGAGMSTLAYMSYENASPEQKKIIETVPEWMRQTYWLFPSDNGKDIVRIPKPYESSMVTSVPIEFALYNEHLVGSDIKDYLKNWATETFLVDPSLNPVTPLFETALNKDLFTKREITNSREAHLAPSKQGDVHTPYTAEMLSKGVKKATGYEMNPRQIEHFMKGYSPVTSENINALIDRLAEVSGLRKNQKPAGTAGSIEQGFNPFLIQGDSFQSDRIGDVYQAADDVQGLKKRTQQEEGNLFEFPNAYRAINKLKQHDQDFASQIRDIDNDPNLDRLEKQQLREELIAQRNTFANSQVELGRTDVNEDTLAQLESEFSGLGAKTTKTDLKAVVATRLQEQGVPKHVINQMMEMDLDENQLLRAATRLLQAN